MNMGGGVGIGLLKRLEEARFVLLWACESRFEF